MNKFLLLAGTWARRMFQYCVDPYNRYCCLCRHLGWAAQWLEYMAELRANLSQPALTVPVFEDAVRPSARPCLGSVNFV